MLCIASMQSGPCRAQEQTWSFDIGGQVRERFESANNPVFGLSTPMQNDYLLHRAMLSAEGRSANGLRVRVELASSLTSGWQGQPPPTQDDPLDVLQAFIEKSLPLSGGQLSVRAGRQELNLGSARLVSVRDGTNVRRAFDGIRASWAHGGDGIVTAFFLRPVFPEEGVFDDRSSRAERFWGVYATWPAPGFEGPGIDTYYLGLDRADAVFAQGKARELRHTVGVRAFGERAGWDWNIEAAWQWGSFGGFEHSRVDRLGGCRIRVLHAPADPANRAQGRCDQRRSESARSAARYFQPAVPTPQLLLRCEPRDSRESSRRSTQRTLSLTDRLSVTVSWDGLWKHEAADAFYAPPLSPVDGTSLTRSRDVGWQASALVEWQATEQLELAATHVTFEPRSVIRQANGHAGSFFAAWIRWTF